MYNLSAKFSKGASRHLWK